MLKHCKPDRASVFDYTHRYDRVTTHTHTHIRIYIPSTPTSNTRTAACAAAISARANIDERRCLFAVTIAQSNTDAWSWTGLHAAAFPGHAAAESNVKHHIPVCRNRQRSHRSIPGKLPITLTCTVHTSPCTATPREASVVMATGCDKVRL